MWCCVGGELKHENLVSNKLIKVKFLPSRDNKADLSSVSPSSERIGSLRSHDGYGR